LYVTDEGVLKIIALLVVRHGWKLNEECGTIETRNTRMRKQDDHYWFNSYMNIMYRMIGV
jgi:hypothetical protein